ncbi:hypothetical protein F9Y90_05150 (plasmid) [Borrelia miyamotoi]|uniref:Variable large protein n=1 Tax=Borrelia miyamotoi TaxID=47466 RepID=A0A5P8AUL3_9SPIR|nr:hypothetical protein F9Y90_05150 [Borrelia miyamotoi]
MPMLIISSADAKSNAELAAAELKVSFMTKGGRFSSAVGNTAIVKAAVSSVNKTLITLIIEIKNTVVIVISEQ